MSQPNLFYTVTVPVPEGSTSVVVKGLAIPFTPTDAKGWVKSPGNAVAASVDTSTISSYGATFNLSPAPSDTLHMLVATFYGFVAMSSNATRAIPVVPIKSDFLSTSMRYHEEALARWFNSKFFVVNGIPQPVIFATPMDAFSTFDKLWGADNNPYAYLLKAVDENGTPLYQPYPATVKTPLISIYRKGWKYRPGFSLPLGRAILGWPVTDDVSHLGQVTKCDLGNVTVGHLPQAWDYRWQVDHFCLRPDTQAVFISALMHSMTLTAGEPQTWIPVNFPGWGQQLCRLSIDGDIENTTPEQPEEGSPVQFRTSFSVTVQGYNVDIDLQVKPALWLFLVNVFGNAEAQGSNTCFTVTVPIPQGQNFVKLSGFAIPFTPVNARAWTESGVGGAVIRASLDRSTLTGSGATFNLSVAPSDGSQMLIATFYGFAPISSDVSKQVGVRLTRDLRKGGDNPTFNAAPNLPPDGNCPQKQ